MATRTGSAVWEGTLKQGRGTMKLAAAHSKGLIHFHRALKKGRGPIRKS